MKIGMNLWTVYGWSLPERPGDRVLGALSQLGIDAVEIVVDEELNSAEQLLAHEDDIKAALARHNLTVPTVASALFWRYNLGSKREDVREAGIAITEGMCRVAKAYAAKTILIVAGQQESHTPFALTWDNAVRSIRRAAKTAEELDILIGVENVGSNFLNSPGEMARFIADVDHPSVGCYLDLGNAMFVLNGYPENWCTALAGKIVAVHVKDYVKKSRELVCCGEGDLPWAGVLPVLRECGYDDYLMVETPPEDKMGDIDAGLDAARQSVNGIRPFVKALG
jgi:L-ribulose-5-phosphate 3-epimerase